MHERILLGVVLLPLAAGLLGMLARVQLLPATLRPAPSAGRALSLAGAGGALLLTALAGWSLSKSGGDALLYAGPSVLAFELPSGRVSLGLGLGADVGALAISGALSVALALVVARGPEGRAPSISLALSLALLGLLCRDAALPVGAAIGLGWLALPMARGERAAVWWAALGDAALLATLPLLASAAGSLSLSGIALRASQLSRPVLLQGPSLLGFTAASVAATLLALASGARGIAGGRLLSASGRGAWPGVALLSLPVLLPLRGLQPLVGGTLTLAGGLGLAVVGLLLGVAASAPALAPLRARLAAAPRLLVRVVTELDRDVIAAAVERGVPALARGLSALSARVLGHGLGHRGVRLSLSLLAAVAVAGWMLLPHPAIAVRDTEGMRAELRAAGGPGVRYLWDFDSDGAADTPWLHDPAVAHVYEPGQLSPGVVVAIDPGVYGRPLRVHALSPGERVALDVSDLGERWQRSAEGQTPPLLEATRDGLRVRINDARARRGSELLQGPEVVVGRGERIALGRALISVTGRAEPTVYVQTGLGLTRSTRRVLPLPGVRERPTASVGGVVGER